MNFFQKAKSSLYDPDFYSDLRQQSLGSAITYFILLVLILSAVVSVIFGLKIFKSLSAENINKLANFYPKELRVKIEKGEISTNLQEPYFIKNDSLENSSKLKNSNFLVIDTKTEFSIDAFNKYDASVWIGKNFIVSSKRQGQAEFQDVSKIPDYSLSYEKISNWASILAGYRMWIFACFLILIFLSFCIYFVAKIVWLLIASVFVMFLVKTKSVILSYESSLKVSLYAVTAPLIIQACFFFLGISHSPFLFFYTIVLLLVVLMNVKEQKNISSEIETKQF